MAPKEEIKKKTEKNGKNYHYYTNKQTMVQS